MRRHHLYGGTRGCEPPRSMMTSAYFLMTFPAFVTIETSFNQQIDRALLFGSLVGWAGGFDGFSAFTRGGH